MRLGLTVFPVFLSELPQCYQPNIITKGLLKPMNQKELNELRRRWKPDKNAISRIYGCFVNGNKEIVTDLDESLGMMTQEEAEKYLSLLKKALSGALGKNLIDIVFSTRQVMTGEEHRMLMELRTSGAKDARVRQAFYQKVSQSLDMGESNFGLRCFGGTGGRCSSCLWGTVRRLRRTVPHRRKLFKLPVGNGSAQAPFSIRPT